MRKNCINIGRPGIFIERDADYLRRTIFFVSMVFPLTARR